MSTGFSSGAQRVLKNTVALALARIIQRVSTLLLALLIAKALGADGLGAYSIAMAFFGAITLMGDAGTTMYLIRELAREPSRTSAYVVHLSVVVVVASAGLVGLALLVIPRLGYSDEVALSVTIIVFAVFPSTLNSIQEAVFVAHGRTELEAVTIFVTTSAYVGLSVWLLQTGHGVPSLVSAYVAVQFLVTVIYFLLITRYIARLRFEFRWPLARRLVGELKSFAGSSLLAAFFARPEIILLSLFATEREVGFYGAAVRIAEVWVFIPQVFMNNVFPLLSRSFHLADDRFLAIQERAMRAVLAYTLPLTAGMVAAAPLIIHTLFGDGFDSASDLLRVLGLNVTVYGMSEVVWRSLSARNRQDLVLKVQVFAIFARLAAGAALIVALSSLGAAIAATAGSALSVVLLARATRRTGAATPSPLVAWRFGVAAAVMAIATIATMSWLALWAVVPVAAAIYIASALSLGALTADDVGLLRSLLSPRSASRAG